MQSALFFALLLLTAPGAKPAAQALPRTAFSKPKAHTVKAPEGHTTLRWRVTVAPAPPGVRYELQQAPTARFHQARTRYVGPDRAVFLSGLAEGEAYFRVRAVKPGATAGPWSRTIVVRVRYVSRRLLLALMALGALLLLTTVGVILLGHRRSRAHPTEGADA